MKTLLITGSYKILTNDKICYNVALFGQSEEVKELNFIRDLKIVVDSYNELNDICREIYCNYYNTDLYNIIGLDHINKIN